MSEPEIPLLTDIVDETDAEEATPEQSRTTQSSGDEPTNPFVRSFQDFVLFEPDNSRSRAARVGRFPEETAGRQEKPEDENADSEAEKEQPENREDVVEFTDIETVIAELQTRIALHTFELTDKLMRAAFADIEAKVFRQISTNLRQQLPELIDSVVRENLLDRQQETDEGE